ncbi:MULTISPECIES: hypothetical protein [Bosea]|uniref:hypothetical protein n=1 Tax=Bosea TaxID=85413 RepID=UPI00140F3E26|nr:MULTISPECIES: hypothetical protein [Bosea]MCR4523476.1 hypothetical protein [Bosea sp. 47.2.35]MDR6830487.1 hypothetical protein [Bosea robiniae]MDR6897242.1 hypothetical protein [Bosea sp. BE109]MDR7140570.1 hypothetical protein [Bosea sp. BE168]MDR7177267.1 hypothetical protein [Bosea sp. BE271]
MTFPSFFAQAPRLKVRDPLAAFLGASEDGILDYSYEDAVRLAGHSCPAVAGAYLMVINGLSYLYEDELPERGGVEVLMRDERDQGTTGVLASVVTLLTGATAESGFHGIGPAHRFARRDLLRFGADIEGVMALRRRDTGQGVVVDIDTGAVPHAEEMAAVMPRAVSGQADEAGLSSFAALWQDRVRRMLIDHADDPKLIHLYDWEAADAPVA